jgi:hypothetical protein
MSRHDNSQQNALTRSSKKSTGSEMRDLLTAALVVVFVLVISQVVDYRAPQRVLTGEVVDVRPGDYVAVVLGPTNPQGVQFSLRGATDSSALRPGARVTVWYRSVGERRFVADRVELVD